MKKPPPVHFGLRSVIDAHVHIFPDEIRKDRRRFCTLDRGFAAIYQDPRARLATVEELIRTLDEIDARGAVVAGFAWEDMEIGRDHNDYILEACERSGGRLVGMGCVSPASGSKGIRELERCLQRGMAGIGEIATYGQGTSDFDSKFFNHVGELLKNWKCPLMLHVTETVGHSYPGKDSTDLEALYRWIQSHPDLEIILAHWGGGLLFFELIPEVMKACRSVYYDTAASPYLYRKEIYRIATEILGVDRILLGSDFPLIHPKRYIQEIRSEPLSRRAAAAILGKNAARLWRWE